LLKGAKLAWHALLSKKKVNGKAVAF
jgi:hypothetical protein